MPAPQHARTGGDVVVETLTALGATTVFGIPGQHALGLFDALGRSELRFVSSRVENNSAFQADGYARVTNTPAVLVVSTGPGALTSLAGLEEAYATATPVVVISAQIPTAGLGGRRKGLLHQLDDQKASAANVTKTQTTVQHSSAIPGALISAWRTAMTAPQGPVWVEIPEDVLLGPASIPPIHTIPPANYEPAPLRPLPELLHAAARRLHAAQRVAVVAGGGVARAQAAADVRRLAELLDAPVVVSAGGKSAHLDHPLYLGWPEDRAVTSVLEQADVVLAVGTALGEVTSNYFTFAPAGEIIQIDATNQVLESNHRGLGLCADAKEAVRGLLAELEALSAAPEPQDQPQDQPLTQPAAGWPGGAAARVEEVRKQVERRLEQQDCELPRQLLRSIARALPEGTHSFWDMTIAAYWAWNDWRGEPGYFHSAQGAGGLGFAFPAACGAAAAVAAGGGRTVAIAGDGSAMYSLAELAAAVQDNLPVTWLIIDDGGYGILREYMTGAFGQAHATELARPDFIALAQAFAVPAQKVSPDNVEQLLKATFSATGPQVLVLEAQLPMWRPTHLEQPGPGA